jgi:acetyltransferase-like isoleucine patch superfamily enzyme
VRPVIIEDGAFVGSRCVVFYGVRVGREAVLGANVVLTKTNPTIDVHRRRAETSAEAVLRNRRWLRAVYRLHRRSHGGSRCYSVD